MAEPTIAAGYPKAFLDFAVARGADRRTLIGEASGTTEEARRHINRYARLRLDEDDGRVSEHLELVREGGGVWLKYTSPLYADNRLLTESAFARNICGARFKRREVNGV